VKSALACIVLPLFAAASHAAPSLPTFECDRSPLLVRDADIWSSGGVARHRDLLVVEGLIKSIGPTGHVKAPRGARVLNAGGQLMLPGLIDAHVHFVFPGPTANRPNTAVEAIAIGRQMLASGVTSARVHLDSIEHAKLLLDLSRAPCAPMPRLELGGPAFIPGAGNDEQAPVWDPTSVDDATAKVRREHELGFQWIAIHDAHKFAGDTRAAIIETARQLGMGILASGYTQAEVASSLALHPDTIDYLDVSPMPEYAPGLLDSARDQEQLTWVVRVGIHERFRAFQDDPSRVDDPRNTEFFEAGLADELRAGIHKTLADRGSEHTKRMDGAYPTIRRKFEQLRAARIPLAMGTDTGSPGHFARDAIWWEIGTWMKYGATLDEALTAATQGGARVMRTNAAGVLRTGAPADFLLCPAPLAPIAGNRAPDCRVVRGGVVVSEPRTPAAKGAT